MNVKIVMGIVAVFVLFIAGCGGEQSTIQRNYKLGYGAPQIVIDEQRSPSVVFQNRTFSTIFSLFNKAGYPLHNVRVVLGNYDQTFLSIQNPQQFFHSVEAMSAYTGEDGGRVDVFFSGDVLSLHGATDRKETYRIYVSYDSKIEFAPTVCVNTASYDIFDAGCQLPKGKMSFSGQGAPLAVTSMEEVVVGGETPELELRLLIDNKGNGDVEKIKLGQARLGNTPLSCQFRDVITYPDGSISFKKDRRNGEVLCTARLPEGGSYQTTLFIEFFYSYEFSAARQLTIKS